MHSEIAKKVSELDSPVWGPTIILSSDVLVKYAAFQYDLKYGC